MPGCFARSTFRAVSFSIARAICKSTFLSTKIGRTMAKGCELVQRQKYHSYRLATGIFRFVAKDGEGSRIRLLAEREGFEPPIRLPVCRISSAVLSTTQPPLQAIASTAVFDLHRVAKPPMVAKMVTNHLFPATGYHKSERSVELRYSVALHGVGNVRIKVHRRGDSRVS